MDRRTFLKTTSLVTASLSVTPRLFGKSFSNKKRNVIILKTLFGLLLIPAILNSQNVQQKRPENYKPYRYKYSVEKLQQKFSKEMIRQAKIDNAKMNEVNTSG